MTEQTLAFDNYDTTSPELQVAYNNAYDSALTRGPAQIFEKIAEPLNKYIYGPITEYNRTLGMVVANATLTAPRLLEPKFGKKYIDYLQQGRNGAAFVCLMGKTILKLTDGLDGPVTRANSITSLAGAGFDGFTDMVGTRDDGQRAKEAYDLLGVSDPITTAIINTRLGIDIAAALIGGAGNTMAAKYAEKHGVTIAEHDKPKANAYAKLKFFLSAGGDAVMLLGTLSKKPETVQKTKKIGGAILIGSAVAGGVSLIKYLQSTTRNYNAGKSDKETELLDFSEDKDSSSGPYFQRKPVRLVP